MPKRKILIVEDETDVQKILTENLKQAGYQVVNATNGEKGVKAALQEHPDLILMDIIMPVKDGMTALKEIRRDAWGKNVPVIVLTNLSDGDRSETADNLGVQDYLVKADWDLREVVEKVKQMLSR